MAEFEKAIALDPNSFEGHYFYARACFAEGKLERAAAFFERAAEIKPDDFQSLILLRQIYRSLGRDAEGEDAARKGIERAEQELNVHPENPRPAYLGASAAPSMAAAFAALSRAETPRATSALNAIQRTAGAFGTALFAILLQHSITANLPHHPGGLQAIAALPQQPGSHAATALAAAFGTTFWVAAALIACSVVPALLLPRAARERDTSSGQAPEQARAHNPQESSH